MQSTSQSRSLRSGAKNFPFLLLRAAHWTFQRPTTTLLVGDPSTALGGSDATVGSLTLRWNDGLTARGGSEATVVVGSTLIILGWNDGLVRVGTNLPVKLEAAT